MLARIVQPCCRLVRPRREVRAHALISPGHAWYGWASPSFLVIRYAQRWVSPSANVPERTRLGKLLKPGAAALRRARAGVRLRDVLCGQRLRGSVGPRAIARGRIALGRARRLR